MPNPRQTCVVPSSSYLRTARLASCWLPFHYLWYYRIAWGGTILSVIFYSRNSVGRKTWTYLNRPQKSTSEDESQFSSHKRLLHDNNGEAMLLVQIISLTPRPGQVDKCAWKSIKNIAFNTFHNICRDSGQTYQITAVKHSISRKHTFCREHLAIRNKGEFKCVSSLRQEERE